MGNTLITLFEELRIHQQHSGQHPQIVLRREPHVSPHAINLTLDLGTGFKGRESIEIRRKRQDDFSFEYQGPYTLAMLTFTKTQTQVPGKAAPRFLVDMFNEIRSSYFQPRKDKNYNFGNTERLIQTAANHLSFDDTLVASKFCMDQFYHATTLYGKSEA